MTTRAGRTAQDAFKHRAQDMIGGDLDDIVSGYAEDALFITQAGVLPGRDGVREGFTKIFEDLPHPRFDVRTRILEGDVLFLEWTATATRSRRRGWRRDVGCARRRNRLADRALHRTASVNADAGRAPAAQIKAVALDVRCDSPWALRRECSNHVNSSVSPSDRHVCAPARDSASRMEIDYCNR